MEKRRFLVAYSFKGNLGYSVFANDEIILNSEEIFDERDIPILLKRKMQKISIGDIYPVKTLINFWEIRDKS